MSVQKSPRKKRHTTLTCGRIDPRNILSKDIRQKTATEVDYLLPKVLIYSEVFFFLDLLIYLFLHLDIFYQV